MANLGSRIRRKGFPTLDKVFPSQSEAETAAQVHERLISNQPSDGNDITLQEAWDRYAVSAYFSEKADRTKDTEAGRIKPVLNKLGAYSLQEFG
jgi:hypothetical protein